MSYPTKIPGTAFPGLSPPYLSIALWLLALLPFSVTFILFYPDERYYLDAALQMVADGDWALPRYPDGSPRLNKPMLTYWIIAASFQAFGVSIASARLPFLLAGVLLIWTTHSLAKQVLPTRNAHSLAVAILLANPLLWLASLRCIPDIWLALFLNLAVVAYFKIRHDSASRWQPYVLFGGLGLACATKGIPAVMLIGILALHEWRERWPALPKFRATAAPVLGLAIGAFGFVPIIVGHCGEGARAVWEDQVSGRVTLASFTGMGRRAALIALALAVAHVIWLRPWLIARSSRLTNAAAGSESLRFLTLASAVWFLAATASWNGSVRYLIPAMPWLAILLAHSLSNANHKILLTTANELRLLIAIASIVLFAVTMWVMTQFTFEPIAWSCVLLAFGVTTWQLWQARRNDVVDTWCRSASVLPLVMLVAFGLLAPFFLPDLGSQARQEIQTSGQDLHKIVVSGGGCQSTRLRVALAACTSQDAQGTPLTFAIDVTTPRLNDASEIGSAFVGRTLPSLLERKRIEVTGIARVVGP